MKFIFKVLIKSFYISYEICSTENDLNFKIKTKIEFIYVANHSLNRS